VQLARACCGPWDKCIKSHKCYISRSRGGGISGAISMTFGLLVHMVNVINSAKFDHCSFSGLNLARF
jgi:hypothetical protein